jgi:hypothetical protein
MEGFNEAQKKELKSRRCMFRAGSEEEKWKIIYLILFPDTALNELPSPCKKNISTPFPTSLTDSRPRAG